MQALDLHGCTGLRKVPLGVGSLTNLETLDLSFCEGLDQLPDGLGALTKLQTLNLSWCKGLTQLPDEMGTLTGLTSLLVSPNHIRNLLNTQNRIRSWTRRRTAACSFISQNVFMNQF